MKSFSKTVSERSSMRITYDGGHQTSRVFQTSLRYTEKGFFGRVKRTYEVSPDGGKSWTPISQAEYDKLMEAAQSKRLL